MLTNEHEEKKKKSVLNAEDQKRLAEVLAKALTPCGKKQEGQNSFTHPPEE